MSNPFRKIVDRVFSRYLSTGLVFVIDVFVSFLSALFVMFGIHYLVTSLGSSSPIDYWNRFTWIWLVASTVSAGLMFWLFKCYRIIIRHSSMADIFRFAVAVLCATIVDGLVLLATGMWHPSTWLVLIAYFVMAVFMVVFCRVLMIRIYEELQRRFRVRSNNLLRVLIYGTGEKSIALQTRLRNSRHYEVAGYLTDILSEDHLTSNSVPVFVFQDAADVERIVKKHGVGGIIFAQEIGRAHV